MLYIKRFKGIVKGDLTICLSYVIKILFVVAPARR